MCRSATDVRVGSMPRRISPATTRPCGDCGRRRARTRNAVRRRSSPRSRRCWEAERGRAGSDAQVIDPDETLSIDAAIAGDLRRAGVPAVASRAVAVGPDRVAPFDLSVQDLAPGTALRDLPEEVAETVSSRQQVDDELRHLLEVLRG